MRRAAGRAALALVLAVGSGCSWMPSAPEPKPINCYFGDERDLHGVRRVMVLPFDVAPGVDADTFPLRTTFLQELAKEGLFEVVPLPDRAEEDREIQRSWIRGRLSTEAVVALCKRYQLDAVLLGTVTSYRAYQPPHLGLKVQLLSIHAASTVWAAEGTWDANESASLEDLQHYAESYAAPEASMHGWQLALLAPTKFAAFVSHRIVGTWRAR